MGAFEDRIVASLVALQAERTADDGAMFVLPTSLMHILPPAEGDGLRLVWHGEVALLLPTEEPFEFLNDAEVQRVH